ncbi:MAG: response regulator transcription factor [Ignavibacterium album]|uniref:response regulator transcription factor n=1 Tax=Ignavibacterium album TaxID=591197 RepID=UPI00350E3A36|nr:response regulator transcription factor [Ignavibacterium album]
MILNLNCCNNCDIAGKLNLSHHTVETHKSNLIKKLQLKNTTELIAYAIKNSEEIKSQLEKIKSK